jgi:hypothetical protein
VTSLSHIAYANAVADERVRAVPRGIARPRRHRPPPSWRRIAFAARLARTERPAA